MEILGKHTQGRKTMWDVLAGGSYLVSCDEDGVWHCSCPGASFRGSCSHIHAIRITREWRHIQPKIEMPQPTPLAERPFMLLMAFPRFILQLKYPGPRILVAFGINVYVNQEVASKLNTEGSRKLAGTVVECVFDGIGTYLIWDVLWFKGSDIRQLPLRERMALIEPTAKLWKNEMFTECPFEHDFAAKKVLYAWNDGCVLLKDIGAAYCNRPRTWLEVR